MNKKYIFLGIVTLAAIVGIGIQTQAATTATVGDQPSAELITKIKTITSTLKSIKIPVTAGDKPKIHYTDNGWCVVTNHGEVIGAYPC